MMRSGWQNGWKRGAQCSNSTAHKPVALRWRKGSAGRSVRSVCGGGEKHEEESDTRFTWLNQGRPTRRGGHGQGKRKQKDNKFQTGREEKTCGGGGGGWVGAWGTPFQPI
jgi:hypothetical protein